MTEHFTADVRRPSRTSAEKLLTGLAWSDPRFKKIIEPTPQRAKVIGEFASPAALLNAVPAISFALSYITCPACRTVQVFDAAVLRLVGWDRLGRLADQHKYWKPWLGVGSHDPCVLALLEECCRRICLPEGHAEHYEWDDVRELAYAIERGMDTNSGMISQLTSKLALRPDEVQRAWDEFVVRFAGLYSTGKRIDALLFEDMCWTLGQELRRLHR